jgi:hypothetical protein
LCHAGRRQQRRREHGYDKSESITQGMPLVPLETISRRAGNRLANRFAHEPALTAGVVPAEVFSFALFVVAVCSYAVFWQDFSAISRRLNHESHGTILEFMGSRHFR